MVKIEVKRSNGTVEQIRSTSPPQPQAIEQTPQRKVGLHGFNQYLVSQEKKSTRNARNAKTFWGKAKSQAKSFGIGVVSVIPSTIEGVKNLPSQFIRAGHSGSQSVIKATTHPKEFVRSAKAGAKMIPGTAMGIGKNIVKDVKSRPAGVAGEVAGSMLLGYAVGKGYSAIKSKVKPRIIGTKSKAVSMEVGGDTSKLTKVIQSNKVKVGKTNYHVTSKSKSLTYKGGNEWVQSTGIKSTINIPRKKFLGIIRRKPKKISTTGSATGYFKEKGGDILGKTKYQIGKKSGTQFSRTKEIISGNEKTSLTGAFDVGKKGVRGASLGVDKRIFQKGNWEAHKSLTNIVEHPKLKDIFPQPIRKGTTTKIISFPKKSIHSGSMGGGTRQGSVVTRQIIRTTHRTPTTPVINIMKQTSKSTAKSAYIKTIINPASKKVMGGVAISGFGLTKVRQSNRRTTIKQSKSYSPIPIQINPMKSMSGKSKGGMSVKAIVKRKINTIRQPKSYFPIPTQIKPMKSTSGKSMFGMSMKTTVKRRVNTIKQPKSYFPILTQIKPMKSTSGMFNMPSFPKVISIPKTRTKQRQSRTFTLLPKLSTIQREKSKPLFNINPTHLTPQKSKSKPMLISITPPPPAPKKTKLPFFMGLSMSHKKGRGIVSPSGNWGGTYFPSLGAVMFNIKAIKPKKINSGLNFRGLLK